MVFDESTATAFPCYRVGLLYITGHDGGYNVVYPDGRYTTIPADSPSEANAASDLAAHMEHLATPDQIKAEAHRRILAIVPMWKQNNLTAVALDIKTKAEPSAQDLARLAAIQSIWDRVVAIRTHSDTLEANPPPVAQLSAANWPE